jgi:PAS domain S-box-containing protein
MSRFEIDGDETYRRIMGLLPVAVYMCEAPSGIITYFNQQAAELWGSAPALGDDSEERFCGSFRLWRPDGTLLSHAETPMAVALREGRSFRNQDVVIERPDGSRISVLVNIDPIVDASGRVVAAINAFHETTTLKAAQQRLERSEEQLRAVVETTPACIQVISSTGTVIDMNAAGLAMIDATHAEQIQGRSVLELIGEADREAFRSLHERVCRGAKGKLELEFVGLGGIRRRVELHAAPLHASDGSVQQLAIAHDITERTRAEELRERLAAIVESSDDAIISHDLDGTITSWNRGAERLYGYPTAEIVGRPVSLLIPSDHRSDFPIFVERLRRGERIDHHETVRVARDGRRIDVSLTVSPVRTRDGVIVGASKIARDISDRKRAEAVSRRHAERTRLLWEAAGVLLTTDEPDAMLKALFAKIGGSLGLDLYFNYMLAEDERTLQLVSCVGLRDDLARSISRLELGQAVCGEVARRREPLVVTHIQESALPMVQLVKGFGVRAYACSPLLAGDRLLGTLSFASRTRDRLDPDEVEFLQTISHHVTAAYERLRLIAQLRDQDRRKDEFLAMLAHELRNPLAPIRTGVELLQRSAANPALLDRAGPIMERQLQHMVRLVDDLLDVSRISRNKLELRKARVELAAVIHSALETSRPLIDAGGHALTVTQPEEPIALHADPVRLAQAFSNLLNNAAKYTESGGRIALLVELCDGEVVVRVRDTGVGIPPEKLPHIFEMFVQVDQSLERTQGGLGIGLTLTRRLVQMHGGTLVGTSEGAGKGSEFIVRLPVAKVMRSLEREPDSSEEASARERRRIVVVDDNRDSAEMLAAILELLGHDVVTAHDGLEAVQRVQTIRPDVAFLDLGMPKLSGFEAARRIRDQPWGRGVTLVALTGWGHEEDRRRSREAGFDAHLVKPVDVAQIEKLLGGLDR